MIQIDDIKNLKILIVDDNSQNIRIVSSVLNQDGFNKILFATSGEMVFKIIEKEVPDIILLDIIMPQMDGFEVCKNIKKSSKHHDIPIIFLTAKIDNSDIIKGLQLGAVDYITKPFDNEILLTRVKTHLINRAQAKMLALKNCQLEELVNKEIEKRSTLNAKIMGLFHQDYLGISFLDTEGKIIECNDKMESLLGYEKNEILQMLNYELTFKEDREKSKGVFNKIRSGESSFEEFDRRCIKKDGTIIWFHSVFASVKSDSDNKMYIASICEDITEKVKLQNELKYKEQMLITQSRHAAMGNMIGMIAHQWRQPLTIINLIATNIQMNIEFEESNYDVRLKDEMISITEQVDYLNKTIEDFRNFFKPLKLKVTTDLNNIIEQTLRLLGKSLENNNIIIQKEYLLKTTIEAYPNELMQVLINIINNAKDQIQNKDIKDGLIKITTNEDDDNIFVNILDNVGGIPEEYMNKIGDLYFTSKGENGTGLGLYMSKLIVKKQLNGKLIWENNGYGAEFIIIIPKTLNIIL